MNRRSALDPPTLEELLALNSWPLGTVGHMQERDLLITLHRECMRNGFGRVMQLMEQITEIWRDPAKADYWRKAYEDRAREMKEIRGD
jgi:hypothetical protein